jgi:hypothetical protein
MLPYLVKDDPQFLNDKWTAKILEEGRISSDDEFNSWVEYHLKTCSEPSMMVLRSIIPLVLMIRTIVYSSFPRKIGNYYFNLEKYDLQLRS